MRVSTLALLGVLSAVSMAPGQTREADPEPAESATDSVKEVAPSAVSFGEMPPRPDLVAEPRAEPFLPLRSAPVPLSEAAPGTDLDGTIAISLATGDFDGDGVRDLLTGRSGPGRNLLVLRRGNVDAIFPHRPEAKERSSILPFHAGHTWLEIGRAPDFLVAVDFDNDGHLDAVVAARGRFELQAILGDGRGGVRSTEVRSVPGAVTAMTAGEFGRIDGLTDLAVAVEGVDGPLVTILAGPDGALRADAESIPLAAPAERLAMHERRSAGLGDLRIVAAGQTWQLEGRDRRRSHIEALRGDTAPPVLRRGGFPAEDLQDSTLAMRLNVDALPDVVLIGEGPDPVVHPSAIEATITVDSAADSATAGDGVCTLREAIANANGDTDGTAGDCAAGAGADVIAFDIGGGGSPETITPGSALPSVSGPTTLNANTQACGTPPCIVLDGNATTNSSGLTVTGGNSVVRGFAIHSFDDEGVAIASNGNFVESNYIGVDQTGSLDLGNLHGVFIVDSDGNTVGGTTAAASNLISGQSSAGVQIRVEPTQALAASGNVVIGNVMGLNAALDDKIPNLVGMEFSASSGNTCGGTLPGTRNILSGNTVGLSAFAGATNNLIQGNYIGTDPTGAFAISNSAEGLYIHNSPANTYGGTAAGAGNVISGNESVGIVIFGFGLTGDNVIQGNRIGTDATGSSAVPNSGSGILLDGSPGNMVGGSTPAARNILSANGISGIALRDPGVTGNAISGNIIGSDPTTLISLGNAAAGIILQPGADGNTFGGTGPDEGNVIGANGGHGISADRVNGNLFLGNHIGTDLSGTGFLGNALSGLLLDDSSDNTVGGSSPGARNVISGNLESGVAVDSDPPLNADGNVIQGNYIGTDGVGETAIANVRGISLNDCSNTLVGGTEPGARNVVSGNSGNGVEVHNFAAIDNQIVGNYIGVNASGNGALGNLARGILLNDGPTNTTIGGSAPGAGNLISANVDHGIHLFEVGPGTLIAGNIIGLDVSGTIGMGNEETAINVQNSPGTTIGGTTPGARNVISDNGDNGIRIGDTSGAVIQGNYIGPDITGTVGFGQFKGVDLTGSSGVLVGGTAPGAGNLISFNSIGVVIEPGGGPTDDNVIQGNLIGTDATGTQSLGNTTGIQVHTGTGHIVGGTDPGAGNVISGNVAQGINLFGGSGHLVQGNLIGTDTTGTVPIGNGGAGIAVLGGDSSSIGGTVADAANVIAHNGAEGVRIGAGARFPILGNSISGNGALGIDLGNSDGVTPNDALDADGGPNFGQNFPDLVSADATPADVTIDGMLGSRPNSNYRIEFFASNACDGSGHGEGARFLGFVDVSTDGSGDASFDTTLTRPVSDGEAITATATDLSNSTSEFSACVDAICSAIVTFPSTLLAADTGTLVWSGAEDVRFAKGALDSVSTYATSEDGVLSAATSLDISGDAPAAGVGLYYVVKPLGCGSWQTTAGAEPGRDGALP